MMSAIKLKDLISESVDDAFKQLSLIRNADLEKDAQHGIEAEVSATAGKGSAKEKTKNEADAPSRSTQQDPLAGATKPESDPVPPAPMASGTTDNKPDAEEIDSNAIIDKFNIIRSGRSMNDRDVSTQIQKYVNSMTSQQRSAVFSVLQKIGSIVSINADATRLTKPNDEPSAVQAARLQMLQKRREDSEAAAEKVATAASKPDVLSQQPKEQTPEREPKDDEFELPVRAGKRMPR